MNQALISLIPTLPLIENPEDINESTRLEKDLKLNVYEARSFFIRYSEKFDVDISKLHIRNYFPDENPFNRFIWFLSKNKGQQITIGDMLKAIPYKRINEAVIKDIAKKNSEKPLRKKIYFKTKTYYKPIEIFISALLFIAITIVLAIVALYV